MAPDHAWRDRALSALLQQMSAQRRGRESPSREEYPSAASFAHAEILAFPRDLTGLATVAPRATDAALALFDTALRDVPRSELFDDGGRRLEHPRLLASVIRVVFAETDGRALIKVRSSARSGIGVKDRSEHVVLIGGVQRRRLDDGGRDRTGRVAEKDWELFVTDTKEDDSNNGEAYFYCTCRAFEYKHAGEIHCKHIVAAGLAIVCNFASVTSVRDEDFVGVLASSSELPSTATGGSRESNALGT